MEDARPAFAQAIDAMIERSDFLAKQIEASLTGDAVMVRVVGEEITAEIVRLSPSPMENG